MKPFQFTTQPCTDEHGRPSKALIIEDRTIRSIVRTVTIELPSHDAIKLAADLLPPGYIVAPLPPDKG